jgi:hypothetical protein
VLESIREDFARRSTERATHHSEKMAAIAESNRLKAEKLELLQKYFESRK